MAAERSNWRMGSDSGGPNAVNHGVGRPGQQPPSGPDAVKRVLTSLQTAFPDRHWQIDDLIVEGDKGVCRMTVSGTFGEIPQIPVEDAMLITDPPTGRPYSVQHIHIVRLAEGKIVEHWAARDDRGLLLQLGVIPQLQRAGATL